MLNCRMEDENDSYGYASKGDPGSENGAGDDRLAEKAFGKSLEECTDAQLYHVILNLVKGMMEATIPIDGKKKVYYISAEFLIGKLLSNNLINLGIYDKVDSSS